MSTTIESLELEIKSNSASAESGISALIGSLDRLKTATKGGLGLSSVAKELASVGKAVDSIKSNSLSNITGLVKAINTLNGTKFSDNLGKQLTAIANIDSSTLGAFKTKIVEVTNAVKPLATEMEKIATGFSMLPSKMQKVITSTDQLAKSNKNAGTSFLEFGSKVTTAVLALKKVVTTIGGFITKSSNYIENLHLFNVAMDEYAGEAKNYAEQVSEVLGIDPGEWMYNQGLFQTLITGFGVAGDSASKMSQNLTQLAYDLSSFYNIDVETAMQKLKSGMAGELEPLRAIGYDLSQAKLEATAAELGIDKAVSSMTQAEKAMLRYHAIMTQVDFTHGDMAKTINEPANQLRILKAQVEMLGREIGNVIMPLLREILPYAIAIVKVIREIIASIALFVGWEITEVGKAAEEMATGSKNTETSLENASDEAKKLKSYMMGIDELNVINPNEEPDTSKGAFDIDIPEYDFLENAAESMVGSIVEDMKEWLGVTEKVDSLTELLATRFGRILTTVGLIGGGMLLWKLGDALIKQLDNISIALGAILLIDSILVTFQEGLSWESALTGALGGALAGAGIGFKLGGWKGAIGGIIIGIGVSLVINGITSMLGEGVNVENVLTTIAGVLLTIGGIVTVVRLFTSTNKGAGGDLNKAGDTIGEISSGTGTLTSKLKTLATNLAWGLVIIAEVAAAAILIVGAIAILGWELEKVGKAWEPVIENGDMVLIGVGLGTGILVAIGVICALLGSLGSAIAGQVGLGAAMLVLIGGAAVLFVAEILLVGILLDKVGKAWEPVIENGETIATGIALGTALLIGIGAVAALLGVAAVASAGLLPLAIGLGTLMLVELTIAFGEFTESLVIVANKLKDELHPALEKASEILPDLTTNMSEFTTFMSGFAGQVVRYSLDTAVAGIAGTIGKVIGFFTGDPVKTMADSVKVQNGQFEDLVNELEDTVPKIKEAIKLQKEYNDAMNEYAKMAGQNLVGGIGSFFQGIGEGIGSLFSGRSIDAPNTVSVGVVPTYATGGFPESGQAFIARENGIPEMVGTIGRRTAVANNEQIVESVASGVAEANSEQNALLREQNTLLRALLEKDSGVYLDGRALSTSVDKYKREQGRELIVGGVL